MSALKGLWLWWGTAAAVSLGLTYGMPALLVMVAVCLALWGFDRFTKWLIAYGRHLERQQIERERKAELEDAEEGL